MSDANAARVRGRTAVVVLTTVFESLGRSAARSAGWARPPIVVLPAPFDTRPEDEVRAIARAALPDLLRALGTA